MRKEIIYKYITIDGEEFNNEKDARVHEITLRYKRDLENIEYKTIGKYELYKISTVDEMDSLFYYCGRIDCIGNYNDYLMPCIMCCIKYKSQYEIYHINDVIKQMTKDLDTFKKYREDLHNEGCEYYKCKKGKDNKE